MTVIKPIYQPEDFPDQPIGELSIEEQVGRSNLLVATKAAVLSALKSPRMEQVRTRSNAYQEIEKRVRAETEGIVTLAELEKAVQDALRATSTKIFSQKIYRDNGMLWKTVPKEVKEPDHTTRLKVVELFMKPPAGKSRAGRPKTKIVDDNSTASRLRNREDSLDGNGNGS